MEEVPMSAPDTPRPEHCASCGAGGAAGATPDVFAVTSCSVCAASSRSDLAASAAASASPVDSLYQAVDRLFRGRDGISIHVLRPESVVVIILPSGYRWYVHPPHAGVIDVAAPHAALYGPELAPVPGLPLITLAAVEDLRDLMISTLAGPVARLIDADLTARMEIDLFDPDTLLGEGI
jgi:hypothetical protein